MNIVITGSTRGIGKALANKFLEFGDKVVITSRSNDAVKQVNDEFGKKYGAENVFGIPCDVTDERQVDSLVKFAVDKLGKIDIWINNAGTAGDKRLPLVETETSQIRQVIETNIIGTLYCCRAVLKAMISQGSGHIFNMEGMGSDGKRTHANSLTYATSKAAIPMIKRTLLLETKNIPVGIHDLSPGMVLTDFLLKGDPDINTKKIFNILAEKAETVADYLVPKIRKVKGTGKDIRFLSGIKVMWRFITAGRAKNKFFDEMGNPVNL